MSNAFSDWLRNSSNPFSKHGFRFFREVAARQGIVDFLAVANTPQVESRCRALSSVRETEARILALMHNRKWLEPETAALATGMTLQSVRESINRLYEAGLLNRRTINKSKAYRLSSEWSRPHIPIWGFELKIDKWKRALFQAIQMKAYADYVITVFPPDRRTTLISNIDSFRTFGVGVVLFDSKLRTAITLSRPIAARPSPAHYYYTLAALGRSWQCGTSSAQIAL